VDRFAAAAAQPAWRGTAGTVGFIGRLDEPRKGLPTLLAAMERVVSERPGVRLLVAGKGDAEEAVEDVSPAVREAVTFLGVVSEADKARLLRTVDVYVAPNLGGESFGIILVEAMSAGAPVLASDLDAFARVLDDGRVGVLFPAGDTAALATSLLDLLGDEAQRERLCVAGKAWVRRFDWSTVADELIAVYETVAAGAGAVGEADVRPWRDRLRRSSEPPAVRPPG
jgi:phosphatidylinositol alpha-mannosyltransferase